MSASDIQFVPFEIVTTASVSFASAGTTDASEPQHFGTVPLTQKLFFGPVLTHEVAPPLYSLRGAPILDYVDPTGSVADEDWDAGE